MRVLLIKTSSLGDVIHALPAVSDAAQALGVTFDWVVEEAFAEIPAWHPAVERVIPVALRRWRKAPLSRGVRREWRAFRATLRAIPYDAVLDAQGLVKSALLTCQARGPRHGLDRHSAREPLAALAYRHRHAVAREEHAVTRLRRLFAATLGYAPPQGLPDYGLDRTRLPLVEAERPYLLFLHGTTWPTKHWPEPYWLELTRLAVAQGFQVRLPWGNPEERARAERLAAAGGDLLPAMGLAELAAQLAGAAGVVGNDSGPAHLAAALATPAVTLYGATDPALTGTVGRGQHPLAAHFPCAPCLRRECRVPASAGIEPACYQTLPPHEVWQHLLDAMRDGASPTQGEPS